MKEYLNPNKTTLHYLYLMMAGEAVFIVLTSIMPFFIFLYLLIIAGICMLYVLVRVALHNSKKYKNYLAGLEQNGELAAAEQEFASADRKFGDQLRTGEAHLFIREAGQMIPYSSVDSIHQKITYEGGKEKKRGLVIRFKDADAKRGMTAKEIRLRTGSSDEKADVKSFMLFIVSRNPYVTIDDLG